MKSNAIAAVGIALVNLPLTVKPHPLFRKRRAEMEGRAGATLASLAIAQINPIRFTRGNYSKRAAVALPDPFHRLLPTWFNCIFGRSCGLPSSRFKQKDRCRVDQEGATEANFVNSRPPLEH
jgi:hypothetical protein